MKFNQVTLFGATGLIGSYLLEILLKDSDIHLINLVGRKSFYLRHDKINNIVIDFEDHESISESIRSSEAVFVSIGTTMSKVNGNKQKYRNIDFDIIYNISNACKENSIKQLLIVSSLGADSKSNSFYLRLKGEIEQVVYELNLTSTSIFRPSVLLGNRNEFRLVERILQFIMPLFGFIIPLKLKAIEAKHVARSMIKISKNPKSGFNIYHNKEMLNQ